MAKRITTALAALLASALAFIAVAAFDPAMRPARPDRLLSKDEEGAILFTLVEFQRVYQDFFATGGRPDLLDAMPATKEARHQIFRDLGFLRDAGLVLVQDLAVATLMETRRTGRDTAEALVYEEWNYVFQKAADRTPSSELKGHGQGVRYQLRRRGDGWAVTAWELVTVDPPAPREDAWTW